MRRIMKVATENGDPIYIEIEHQRGEQDASIGSLKLDDFMKTAKTLATEFETLLISSLPKKATLEFGLSASVESGALVGFLAKGGAEANVKITLEWDKTES